MKLFGNPKKRLLDKNVGRDYFKTGAHGGRFAPAPRESSGAAHRRLTNQLCTAMRKKLQAEGASNAQTRQVLEETKRRARAQGIPQLMLALEAMETE